jgi:hypothetical protein
LVRRFAFAALLLSVFVCNAVPASAATLSFTIGGGSEFSGTGATFNGSILIKFEDTGANQVTLTIDATGMTGPSTAFISDFYFNLNPASGINPATVAAGGSLTVNAGSVSNYNSFSAGTNAFQADGDGQFDFNLDLPPPPGGSSNVLGPGESVSLTLTATGLDAMDFNDISVNGPPGKNGFHVAAHVQGLGTAGNDSGWFSDGNGGVVPEPSTMALALVGVAGFGVARLRRRRR